MLFLGAQPVALFARLIDAALERGGGEEPYYASQYAFEDFGPAYRFGHETFSRYRGQGFDDVEPELESLWHSRGDDRQLSWSKARNAVRRVWFRSAEALSEDAGTTARSMQT